MSKPTPSLSCSPASRRNIGSPTVKFTPPLQSSPLAPSLPGSPLRRSHLPPISQQQTQRKPANLLNSSQQPPTSASTRPTAVLPPQHSPPFTQQARPSLQPPSLRKEPTARKLPSGSVRSSLLDSERSQDIRQVKQGSVRNSQVYPTALARDGKRRSTRNDPLPKHPNLQTPRVTESHQSQVNSPAVDHQHPPSPTATPQESTARKLTGCGVSPSSMGLAVNSKALRDEERRPASPSPTETVKTVVRNFPHSGVTSPTKTSSPTGLLSISHELSPSQAVIHEQKAQLASTHKQVSEACLATPREFMNAMVVLGELELELPHPRLGSVRVCSNLEKWLAEAPRNPERFGFDREAPEEHRWRYNGYRHGVLATDIDVLDRALRSLDSLWPAGSQNTHFQVFQLKFMRPLLTKGGDAKDTLEGLESTLLERVTQGLRKIDKLGTLLINGRCPRVSIDSVGPLIQLKSRREEYHQALDLKAVTSPTPKVDKAVSRIQFSNGPGSLTKHTEPPYHSPTPAPSLPTALHPPLHVKMNVTCYDLPKTIPKPKEHAREAKETEYSNPDIALTRKSPKEGTDALSPSESTQSNLLLSSKLPLPTSTQPAASPTSVVRTTLGSSFFSQAPLARLIIPDSLRKRENEIPEYMVSSYAAAVPYPYHPKEPGASPIGESKGGKGCGKAEIFEQKVVDQPSLQHRLLSLPPSPHHPLRVRPISHSIHCHQSKIFFFFSSKPKSPPISTPKISLPIPTSVSQHPPPFPFSPPPSSKRRATQICPTKSAKQPKAPLFSRPDHLGLPTIPIPEPSLSFPTSQLSSWTSRNSYRRAEDSLQKMEYWDTNARTTTDFSPEGLLYYWSTSPSLDNRIFTFNASLKSSSFSTKCQSVKESKSYPNTRGYPELEAMLPQWWARNRSRFSRQLRCSYITVRSVHSISVNGRRWTPILCNLLDPLSSIRSQLLWISRTAEQFPPLREIGSTFTAPSLPTSSTGGPGISDTQLESIQTASKEARIDYGSTQSPLSKPRFKCDELIKSWIKDSTLLSSLLLSPHKPPIPPSSNSQHRNRFQSLVTHSTIPSAPKFLTPSNINPAALLSQATTSPNQPHISVSNIGLVLPNRKMHQQRSNWKVGGRGIGVGSPRPEDRSRHPGDEVHRGCRYLMLRGTDGEENQLFRWNETRADYGIDGLHQRDRYGYEALGPHGRSRHPVNRVDRGCRYPALNGSDGRGKRSPGWSRPIAELWKKGSKMEHSLVT